MLPEHQQDRASLLYRRFQSARRSTASLRLWYNLDLEEMGSVIGLIMMAFFFIFEPVLWWDEWFAGLWIIPVRFLLAAFPLMLFQGWYLHQYLSWRTPADQTLSRYLRSLRFLAASLPLIGILTIPAWRRLLEKKLTRRAAHLGLMAPVDRLPSSLRPFYSSPLLVVWVMFGCLTFLISLVYVLPGQLSALSSHGQEVLRGIYTILHLLSALWAGLALRPKGKISFRIFGAWNRMLRRTLPFLFLLPFPAFFLGIALIGWLIPSKKSVMVDDLYRGLTKASRLPAWTSLRETLRFSWKNSAWFRQWLRPRALNRSSFEGKKDLEIASFYRLRTLGLPFEAGALTWAFGSLTTQIYKTVPRVDLMIRLLPILCAVVAAIGLSIHVAELAARLPRRYAYGLSLLITQVAFLAGCFAFLLLIDGRIMDLAFFISVGGLFCMLLALLFFGPWRNLFSTGDLVIWVLLSLVFAFLGFNIAILHPGTNPALDLLKTVTAFSLLYSPLLFLAFGDWLLRPFSWRHVFDRNLPRRFRTTLALVALSSTLPLGGLAIPFWIYARHRIWPRYEPWIANHGDLLASASARPLGSGAPLTARSHREI